MNIKFGQIDTLSYISTLNETKNLVFIMIISNSYKKIAFWNMEEGDFFFGCDVKILSAGIELDESSLIA